MNRFFSSLVTLLYPQQVSCHVCERYADAGFLCQDCLNELDSLRITQGWIAGKGAVRFHAAPLRYDGPAKELVHQMKYRADYAAAQLLAQYMYKLLINPPFGSIDLVVPVPLHPQRERQRGYNQAQWLAEELCRSFSLELCTDALMRTIPTISQTRRSRTERFTAMNGAFAVRLAPKIRGQRILLIDDVFTTGATANACAQTLRQAGAAEVSVLTACHVQKKFSSANGWGDEPPLRRPFEDFF